MPALESAKEIADIRVIPALNSGYNREP